MRALVICAALALSACSVPQPSRPNRTAPARPALAAIDAFATGYINWTAATVTARMRDLARISVGQARSSLLLLAAQTEQDYELQQGGVANAGTVESVAPLRGSPGRYVVVTREQTTASNTTAYRGLLPAWHIALATVTRLASGRWAVSSWQPEN